MTGDDLNERLLAIIAEVFAVDRAKIDGGNFYFWTDLDAEPAQMMQLVERVAKDFDLKATMKTAGVWPPSDAMSGFLTFGHLFNLTADLLDMKEARTNPPVARAPIVSNDSDIPF